MSSDQKNTIVIPEEEWIKLCAKQCKARRKEHGGTRAQCLEEYDSGVCPECVYDASKHVPTKYMVTSEEAEGCELLPGFFHHE